MRGIGGSRAAPERGGLPTTPARDPPRRHDLRKNPSAAGAVFDLDAEANLTMHFKVQRTMGQDERKEQLLALGRVLKKAGVPGDQTTKRLVDLTRGVVGRCWGYTLMDAKFKDQEQPKATKEGLKASPVTGLPYSKGLGPLASQHLEKNVTPTEGQAPGVARAEGPRFRDEERFVRRVEKGRMLSFASLDEVIEDHSHKAHCKHPRRSKEA